MISKDNFLRLIDANFSRVFSAFSNWPHERPIRYCYINHFFRSAFLALSRKKSRRILTKLKYKNIEEFPSFVAYTKEDLNKLIELVKNNFGEEEAIEFNKKKE